MVCVAGRRDPPLRGRARPADARDAAGTGLPARRHAAVQSEHALHQHDSPRQAAAVSRQSRDRTTHQKHHPLERDGDGRPRQPGARGHRRAHFDVRLGGHAVRGGLQPLFPGPRGRPSGRPRLLPRPCLAGGLRPRVSGGAAGRGPPGTLSPPTRIRG